MEKDDFDVKVVDDHLAVRGEKQIELECSEGHYHVTECAYRRFERPISLPEKVEPGKAEAKYKNGVLRVDPPKAVPRRRRTIKAHVH